MLRVHKYRALPLDEVLRTARAYGYEPGPSAAVVPGRDIILRRIADPAADPGKTTTPH